MEGNKWHVVNQNKIVFENKRDNRYTHTLKPLRPQTCKSKKHAHTHTHKQSHVTDSAGALSTVDNWWHHCAALQWAGYPRSLMFVFMYICFEGGGHKELNHAQNKALGDPASPLDVFHRENCRDK